MREHGPALDRAGLPPAPRRRIATRPVLLTAGAAVLAAGATAGSLLADGGTPAYAATAHPNGTVTLAVYGKSGYAGINTKLRQLGVSQVVVVPVESGCPTSMSSLPAPKVAPTGPITESNAEGKDGPVTVQAGGIPAGDILVVAIQTSSSGGATASVGAAKLTSAPAPSCVSPFQQPPSGSGTAVHSGHGTAVHSGHGTARSTSSSKG